MEHRSLNSPRAGLKVQSRGEGKSPVIEGYAAVYYDGSRESEYEMYSDGSSRLVERIMPGAFDRALRGGDGEDPDDVRALYNHDSNCLMGRTSAGTCRLALDERGLRYEIDPPDTQAARDLLESIRRGDVSGSSFSFLTREESNVRIREDDGATTYVRELRSVRLFDVGPVTFPAYEGTSAGTRAAGEDGREELERCRQAVERDGLALRKMRQQLAELEQD